MVGKILVWLAKSVVVLLAILGAAAGVAVWKFSGWMNGGEKPAQVQAAPVVAPAIAAPAALLVEQEKAAAMQNCECGSGAAECVGPRGGRYCLRPDGSKKYVGG